MKPAREIWKEYHEEYGTPGQCLLVPCENRAEVIVVDTRDGDEFFACRECADQFVEAGIGRIKFAQSDS